MLTKAFRIAIKKGYCEVNPVKGVDWPHEDNRRTRTLSDEEETLILSNMTGKYECLRAPFLTALYVGCRRGEMFKLSWDDVDFERQYVHFRPVFMFAGTVMHHAPRELAFRQRWSFNLSKSTLGIRRMTLKSTALRAANPL